MKNAHPHPRRGLEKLAAVVTAAGVVLSTGCAVHQVNLSPEPQVAAMAPANARSATGDVNEWWTSFQSEELNGLIARGLANNLDLRAAEERFQQALASYRSSRGSAKPKLEAGAGAERDAAGWGEERRENRVEAWLQMRWEIDLVKKLGSARQALAANAQARAQAVREFRLSLAASIAENYFGIIEQRQLLALFSQQKQTSERLLRIIESRYNQGLISKLDVLQQKSQLAEIESQIPSVEAVLIELQNQIGTLVGALPRESTIASIGEHATFPEIKLLNEVGPVDELVKARPSLKIAQAELIAADAETARALAERLPRLVLSADAIWAEGRGGNGTLVSIGAEILQPLLDWGGKRENWVRAKSVYREKLAAFSQAYLRAVWEVESVIQGEIKLRALIARLSERKELLNQTVAQARNRYDAGLADYLSVLTVTQQLYAVEQRQVREQRRLANLRVDLHHALGGNTAGLQTAQISSR